MNIQAPEKRNNSNESELEIHSIFRTIQGEGPFTGSRAIFIRLTGCNLQCPGCDTEYTSIRNKMSVEDIYNKLKEEDIVGPKLVVITGGEPFRQNIAKLCNTLIKAGYTVQIETNGTLPPSKGLSEHAMIVCSPKTGSVNSKILAHLPFFKYVLHADSVSEKDGLPILALDHSASPQVARPPQGSIVYLQPMDCKDELQNELNLKAVTESCLKYGYILQLQIHKLLGVE